MKKYLSFLLALLLSFGVTALTSCDSTDVENTDVESESSSEEVIEPKKIRIGSYNIKHGADVSDSDGVNYADADETAFQTLAEDIKSLDLDIVGIQEIDNLAPRSGALNQLALLSEYTGYQYFYYMRNIAWPSSSFASAGSGILSKYPIIAGSESNTELSRGKSWDQVRMLGYVKINVEGTIINFFNTHLTPLQPEVRAGEFSLINEASKDKEYCFLTGDFNCPSFDEFKVLENLTNYNCDERKFITYPKDQKFMDNICYSDEFRPVENVGGVLENFHSDHSLLWGEFEYTPAKSISDEDKNVNLKVGSFNISGAINVNKDLRVIADDILEQELDIVGLQEVDFNANRSDYIDFMKELSTYTGYKYYCYFDAFDLSFYPNSSGTTGIGILSKYPITSNNKIQLTESDKDKNLEGRALGHAVIDVNGKEINFFTTQLSDRDANVRNTELSFLNSKLSEYANVILTGDFNNDTIAEFDVLENLNKANHAEKPFLTYPNADSPKAVDNVIFSNTFTLEEGSAGMAENTDSDHNMFFATLNFNLD